MVRRDAVLTTLEQPKERIRGFGVRSLALFGSCSRDQTSTASDLDFVVELERKSFDAYMDLKFYLEDIFGVPVDLVLRDSIKPRLREPILSEAVHVPGL